MDQCQRIAAKLDRLRAARRIPAEAAARFGPAGLGPPLSPAALGQLERRHRIALPPGFRRFLLEIGDGGFGPYQGLAPLAAALRAADLSRPSPLARDLWLLEPPPESGLLPGEDYELADPALPPARYASGALPVGHFGCGIRFLLIVSGPAYGSIWVDDTPHDKGIFALGDPPPLDFPSWYENWLDAMLAPPAAEDDDEAFGYFEYGLRQRG